MILYLLYLACLLLSVVVAFANREYLKSRQLFILLPYLFFVFIQELGVFIFTLYSADSTALVYNIYRPITICVFATVYYRIPINASMRRLIIIMVTLYLLVTIVTFIFILPISFYNRYLSLAAGLVITCCGIFFLFNYFNLGSQAEIKKWRPLVFITMGIITFYPVVNISLVFSKLIRDYHASIGGQMLYNLIPRLMSIFMYSCFAYAFYLCRKKN